MASSHITLEFLFRQRLDGGEVLCSLSHENYRSCCNNGSAGLLAIFGFVIPSCITYCLANNDMYSLKYRRYGASIYIYISDAA